MVFIWCKLKNIGVIAAAHLTEKPPYYMDFVNVLPNDCIRIKGCAKLWCETHCRECEVL